MPGYYPGYLFVHMFVEAQCRHCDWNTSLDIPDHYFGPHTSQTRKTQDPGKSEVYTELLGHHENTSVIELREAFTGRLVDNDNDILEYAPVQSRTRGHSEFTLYSHHNDVETECGALEVSSLLVVFRRG